jgi:hypothetical protein
MWMCNYTGQMIDENKTGVRKGSLYVTIIKEVVQYFTVGKDLSLYLG